MKKYIIVLMSALLLTGCQKKETTMEYIPVLGYRDGMAYGVQNYVCWKDMLIWGFDIYKMDEGIYRKTEETVTDLFDSDSNIDILDLKQYENFIITTDRNDSEFLVYDMDTGETVQYQPYNGNNFSPIWYIYNEDIYYISESDADTNDRTLLRMNILSGESRKVYSLSDHDLNNNMVLAYRFAIREDGSIVIGIFHVNDMEADVTEFRRIYYDSDHQLIETTIGELSGYIYLYVLQYNKKGLVLYGSTGDKKEEIICLTDDGNAVQIKESPLHEMLISDEGYWVGYNQHGETFTYRDSEPFSIAFYDFDGNMHEKYDLRTNSEMEAEYKFRGIISDDNDIYIIYSDQEKGDLFIDRLTGKKRK